MKKAFTFLELILYIAIVSIILGAVVVFAWDVLYGRVKSNVQQEVSQNLRLVSSRIAYEIRNASDVNFVNPTSISLVMLDSSRDPTVFDLYNGAVRIGFGNTGDCPVSNPCRLTSNNVNVADLLFTDLSGVGQSSTTIQYSITLESINIDGRSEWEKAATYTSSAETRSK